MPGPAGVAFEWRARHVIGTNVSAWLGPVSGTQFTTLPPTDALATPSAAPVVSSSVHGDGFTDLTITWPASSVSDSRLQIAGPSALEPVDGAFVDVSSFAPTVGTAVYRLLHHGTYWLRVRYERAGFDPSAWAGPSSWVVTVTNET